MIMRSPINTALIFLLVCLLLVGLYTQSNLRQTNPNALRIPQLQKILDRGEMTIVTRNTPTTYYVGPNGPTGFEYELARAFASHLGVTPKFIVFDEFSKILPNIYARKADFAAAGITRTDQRALIADFSNSYQEINQLVIYRGGEKKPRKISDLNNVVLDVVQGSSHEELLSELKQTHDYLTWRSHTEIDINYLLQKLDLGEINYIVCDSNDFEFNKRFYPNLRKGFQLSKQQDLSWVFPKSKEKSLLNAANEFLLQAKESGMLEELHEKHYGHVPGLNYAGSQTFLKHINSRLEELIPIFKQVAENRNLDWRFLAAVSYQESLWNPEAVSPTGVRGLMMLTQATAQELGVEDRVDPLMSTSGGAQYLVRVKNRIPERITEPDRTWMALAAYNVGFGHLEDARILTESRGGNPDRWADVRNSLPLLTQKEWYKKTKFGYARGHEPVLYVRNIRNYYDLLIWKYNENENVRDAVTQIIPKIF